MTEKPASKYTDLGPLHELLLKACPPDRKGRRSIMILSEKLNISYQTIYKWIEAGRIPPKRVLDIVRVSKSAVSREDLLPFVL